MLLASAAAAAWLVAPARSDVEAKLPPDLRDEAWPKIEQTATDDREQHSIFVLFHAKRTAALRKLYEQATTPEERDELRGPLIKAASYAEEAGAMLVANGLPDPEHRGIAWPGDCRKVALRRLHGIGPLQNEEKQERQFAAWRVGHRRVEVVADDDHLLFDPQGAVVARHSTAPQEDWTNDRPPCFLADGTVMTNDPVPGEDGVARFRCVKDGRTIAEIPFIQWQGWRCFHAAYAADGMSLTLWSPGYRGAASGLLEIDGKVPEITAPPADRIMELWPVGRGDSVDLTENNDFLPLPGSRRRSLVKWSTRHGPMVNHPSFSICEASRENLELVGCDCKNFASVLWGQEFGTFGTKPLLWVHAQVPADGAVRYPDKFIRFPAPGSAHFGMWLFTMPPGAQDPELVSWVAGRVVEPPGDPGEEIWLIDADQRVGVLGADRRWRDCMRFTDPDGHPVLPYALFPSLKSGLFAIGGEMVLAGWE